MTRGARGAIAIACGAALAAAFPLVVIMLLGAAPPAVDDALSEVGLGGDEFGALALLFLAAASGAQVGLVAGWFAPDARRLGRRYVLLIVAALALSVLLLTGVVYIGALTNADGPGLQGLMGSACLPLALVGYFLLLRATAARARTTH